MSDFDKEAEREKLREKYGEEAEKRAATEQMSELLLKGATMTNAHCTDCGDPIFRYDGQEFWPTCQKPVAREPAEGGDTDDGTQGDHIEVADPSDDAAVQFGADEDQPAPDTAVDPAQSTPDESPAEHGRADEEPVTPNHGKSPDVHHDESEHHQEEPPEPRHGSHEEPSHHGPEQHDHGVTAELDAAESHLAETVHRFARRAAETDDPRRARDHLAAAREAAEALDAVRF